MTQTVLSLFKGEIRVPTRKPTMAEVVESVAADYGLTPAEVRARSCGRGAIRDARQAAMHACYGLGKSNAQVARFFGLKDHTSVIHARQAHAERMAEVAKYLAGTEARA